ncbi:hypothetical protein HanPI659440_Chr03g0123731 [Helianthus annuus]|nr:hypothetical protein HanPI659440_Chr03g0123731 [Helianthus annuus]
MFDLLTVCCNLPDKLLQVGITRQLEARSTFRSCYSNKFLKADSAAHEALQIFQTDKHRSHVGIGRAKEG